MKTRHTAALAAAFTLTATTSHAAVIFQGDWQYGTSRPTLVITAPITIRATTTGPAFSFVFDNAMDTAKSTYAFANGGGNIAITNGGVAESISTPGLADRSSSITVDIDARDTFLGTFGFNIVAGTDVVILPGSYTFNARAEWSPQLQNDYSFTGNVFIGNGDGD